MKKPKLQIVIPICVQNTYLLELTYKCVEQIKTKANAQIFLAVNRIVEADKKMFHKEIVKRTKFPVVISEEDRGRSVAGSWNQGFGYGIADSADYLMILANDVLLEPNTIDIMLEFGSKKTNKNVTIWSGIASNLHPEANAWANTDGCDFSCCMMRTGDFKKHGQFDENFKPAYFEDNDYAARVILAGGKLVQIHSARYIHLGSQTVRNDAEMHHHSSYWWGKELNYFLAKWGVQKPLNGPEEIRQHYFKHPFNAASKPLNWWQAGMVDGM